jgi:cyclohexadieny/prephenate dehydrogenase
MSATRSIGRIAIVGLGLIGSSLARALAGVETVGYDVSDAVRERAQALNFCSEIKDSLVEAVAGAEIVVLAVPVGATAAVAQAMAPHLEEGAIVSDVGSSKARMRALPACSRGAGAY